MAVLLRSNRLLSRSKQHVLLFLSFHNSNSIDVHPFLPSRHFCDSSSLDGNPNPSFDARSRTPLERQFDTWIDRLRPGFTADDVAAAIRAQDDPDLALDLFRWTALRPGYRHDASSYLSMLQVAVSGRRYAQAEVLVDEVLAGACSPDLPLFNAAIRFCCARRHLFSRAFDLFKKMQQRDSSNRALCRPSVETYSMLLAAVLRRFGKPPVCYVYLQTIRMLARQMKASGVIPDTFALNLIIKAYSKCLEMDEALRVFKEMGLYGCEPNEFSYGYLVQGLCQKGWLGKGMDYLKEMRSRGLVPTASVYMAVVCSLALDRRLDEAIEVVFDMLENGKAPDLLTYRTVLEEMCREGRTEAAFELLEELGRRNGAMSRKMYSNLLEGLHWLCQPHE
ncbi:hypothetical protein Cni_G22674 [Canna indica]|uniref:Pentatricopeptide repeat-containing protein n=1 Tax=Canna indica TaxID=4628 RepID=A0AAQ3KST7_9LILI|nr:hypothetical protein Cni_G22674 [Canna indica]